MIYRSSPQPILLCNINQNMRSAIAPRQVNAPIQPFLPLPTHFVPYPSAYSPRAVLLPPQPPQPVYIPTLTYPVPQNLPVYAPGVQTIPLQGYLPQYQPIYIQGPPLAAQPYYPQYVMPSIPVERHRQMDFNPNFDYEAANFLIDTQIVENSVFCVLCGNSYKTSEKDEHLKKHIRRSDINSTVVLNSPLRIPIDTKVASKKQYLTKPLVQPQQHTIKYEPLVYKPKEKVFIENQVQVPVKDQATGNELSFEVENGVNQSVPYLIEMIEQNAANPANIKANEQKVQANSGQPA